MGRVLNYFSPSGQEHAVSSPTKLFSGLFILFLVQVWGWFILSSFRTTEFGPSLRGAFALAVGSMIFVAPFVLAIFVLWRSTGRRRWIYAAVAVVLPIVTAELWASAQEIWVLWNNGMNPAGPLTIRRWWPFGMHHIIYSASDGWVGTE